MTVKKCPGVFNWLNERFIFLFYFLFFSSGGFTFLPPMLRLHVTTELPYIFLDIVSTIELSLKPNHRGRSRDIYSASRFFMKKVEL
jgi:hypothetical protein